MPDKVTCFFEKIYLKACAFLKRMELQLQIRDGLRCPKCEGTDLETLERNFYPVHDPFHGLVGGAEFAKTIRQEHKKCNGCQNEFYFSTGW